MPVKLDVLTWTVLWLYIYRHFVELNKISHMVVQLASATVRQQMAASLMPIEGVLTPLPPLARDGIGGAQPVAAQ